MMGAAQRLRGIHDAIRGLIRALPPGTERPEWLPPFVLAIGVPSEFMADLHRAEQNEVDAAKWRARHVFSPPAPGVHRLLDLVAQAQAALSANLEPNGPGDEETIDKLLGLFDSPEQRAAEGQAQQDQTDAELWRFLHRTTDETSPECKVMESLTEQFTPAYETDPAEAFVAHVVAGLARFKAEAH